MHKEKEIMLFRKVIRNIHLYLGLISGVVVFIVSITGAMYAFKEEIEAFTEDYKKVQAENKAMIPPSRALEIGKEVLPDIDIHAVIYREAEDAIEVVYYERDPMYYGAVYLNPYSGELIEKKDLVKSFWGFALHGHMALWLPLKIGMPIVAIGVLIFLVLLVTGLVLWWPKSFRIKGVFSFSRKASGATKTLEIHKVLGFYLFLPAFIIGLTGISWLIGGIAEAIYKSFGGEMEVAYRQMESDLSRKDSATFYAEPIDVIWERMRTSYPDNSFLEIHPAEEEESSILVELNREPSTHWKMDYIFFDQYTLKEIVPDHIYGRYELAGLPEKIRRMNYDIHTGNILGLPGKILAFLVSLYCASLPVTGFMLWYGRRKRQRQFMKEMNNKM